MDLAGIIVAVIDGYSLDWAIRGAVGVCIYISTRPFRRNSFGWNYQKYRLECHLEWWFL